MGRLLEPKTVDLCKDCPDEEAPVFSPAPDRIDQAIAGTMHEAVAWRMEWTIDKYEGEVTPEMIAAGAKPVETLRFKDNLLLNAGIQRMLDYVIGAATPTATTVYDATHSRIGVGDSSTAEAATQTSVQAATNKYFKLCSAASRTNQTVTWTASFGTAVANFAWNEFVIDNGTADSTTVSGTVLNRKVISAGTKPNTQTWVATATLTIA